MITEINRSGAHSWDCQRSSRKDIQQLIDAGYWFVGLEKDRLGNELIVMEVLDSTEEILVKPVLVSVHHKSCRTYVKFRAI